MVSFAPSAEIYQVIFLVIFQLMKLSSHLNSKSLAIYWCVFLFFHYGRKFLLTPWSVLKISHLMVYCWDTL